jgi:hypothetical protein
MAATWRAFLYPPVMPASFYFESICGQGADMEFIPSTAAAGRQPANAPDATRPRQEMPTPNYLLSGEHSAELRPDSVQLWLARRAPRGGS